ncbi:MAG: ankyrin repeat domain-containing protein [Legionella longbeachae]|nr:ankyrin repeat domain-containing protein [Legionella longbeachae]
MLYKIGFKNKLFPWYIDILSEVAKSRDCLRIIKHLSMYPDVNFNEKFPYGDTTFLEEVMINLTQGSFISYDLKDKFKLLSYFMEKVQLIDFLLENGVNPLEKNEYLGNSTPLHRLFKEIKNNGGTSLEDIPNAYAQLIDKFIKKGFDVNTTDGGGETLLHLAVQAGCFEAVQYLIANGANINAQDHNGMTALHYAAASKLYLYYPYTRPEFIEYLMEHGANKNILNNHKQTPYDFAQFILKERLNRPSDGISAAPSKEEYECITEKPNILYNELFFKVDIQQPKRHDPATGKPFMLSEIIPAKSIRDDIKSLKNYLSEKYSKNNSNSSKKIIMGENTPTFFSSIVRGNEKIERNNQENSLFF